jgi:hexulose-6-phosphate isomerase
MTQLGIMEGRLVPPEPGRFQSFPLTRWADEFELAQQVPLHYIEWIVDEYGAGVNPFPERVDELLMLARRTGVAVRSLCADLFMEQPFVRCSDAEFAQRIATLEEMIAAAQRCGINRIVIPFVDRSKIENEADEARALQMLQAALPAAHRTGVELHLETALAPAAFAALLAQADDPFVKVNYDSGNSASLGYRVADEFAAYGARIGSVHVKDRVLGGGTVALGTGDVDFPALFDALRAIAYSGDITLQVARGADGDEVAWTRANRAFVERFWPLA